mmetsp:Transcript_66322/g.168197  ORF Transcript_66322/g.168197 Transcript_66322/m.168197 type:complete len:601 (+) Transcript_66322:31-1833(+)
MQPCTAGMAKIPQDADISDEEVAGFVEKASHTTSESADVDWEESLDLDTKVSHKFYRTLTLNSSIYDDALLSPLIQSSHCLRSWAMLFLNFLLQFMVLSRISGVVFDEISDTWDQVYGDKGLCDLLPADHVPQFKSIRSPYAAPLSKNTKFLNCVPDEVFYMYNWSSLDLDGDGNWSEVEADTLTKRMDRRELQLISTQRRILAALKFSAKMVLSMGPYAERPEILQHARTVLTLLDEANASIPHKVFLGEVRPFLDMCLIMDQQLCGNLMWRRAFNRSTFLREYDESGFPGQAPLLFLEMSPRSGGDVHDIIHLCHVTVDHVCPTFFTVEYDRWAAKRKEMCGLPSTSSQMLPSSELDSPWDELTQHLLVAEFDSYSQYEDLQLTPPYMVFLLLILVLWTMSMLEEFRALACWWRVLLGTPASGVEVFSATESDEKRIVMTDFSLRRRMVNILLNVGPRTFISVCTLYLGSRYLILAHTYEDLIMNSLALTFLITIDEMVFAAFVPVRRKNWISNANSLEATPHRHVDACITHALNEFALVGVLVLYVVASIYYEYSREFGKLDLAEAFRCTCQVAGDRCMAAQVLGGYSSVQAAPGFK